MEPTVLLLGLGTGLAFGTSDYAGGIAARRSGSVLAVVCLFKAVAAVAFAAMLAITPVPPTGQAIGWGAAAGVAIGLGGIAYFRGLARGHMGIVATVTAIWSALIPLAAGVVLGERPRPLAWAGIVTILAAIPAITFARQDPDPDRRSTTGLLEATIAGWGFGGYFLALGQAGASQAALSWTALSTAVVGATTVGAAALARRAVWRPATSEWGSIVVAGGCWAAATWTFGTGTSLGWVSIMAVIASLSPIPTMLLARVLLRESLRARQYVGVVVALGGVAVLTASTA